LPRAEVVVEISVRATKMRNYWYVVAGKIRTFDADSKVLIQPMMKLVVPKFTAKVMRMLPKT
jgi:hypothetical protein